MYLAMLQRSGLSNTPTDKLYMIMNEKVKKALNLWTTWDFQNQQVFRNLDTDDMKPVTHIGKCEQ